VGKNALAYHPKSEPKPELPEFVIPFGQRKTLLELNGDTCSWPFGDPADFHRDDGSFYFCGGDSLTGLPYCAYHSGIAYNPGYVRMRDRPGGSKSP
jgi:GcrA cell cycle regulator